MASHPPSLASRQRLPYNAEHHFDGKAVGRKQLPSTATIRIDFLRNMPVCNVWNCSGKMPSQAGGTPHPTRERRLCRRVYTLSAFYRDCEKYGLIISDQTSSKVSFKAVKPFGQWSATLRSRGGSRPFHQSVVGLRVRGIGLELLQPQHGVFAGAGRGAGEFRAIIFLRLASAQSALSWRRQSLRRKATDELRIHARRDPTSAALLHQRVHKNGW